MNFDQNIKETKGTTLVEKSTEKCSPPAQKCTKPFFSKNDKKMIMKKDKNALPPLKNAVTINYSTVFIGGMWGSG